MFDLAKYWNSARPTTKRMFWVINGIYAVTFVITAAVVGYDKGLEFILQRLSEIWFDVLQLFAIIPLTPMLLLVLFDGWVQTANTKQEETTDE